ncbi:DNA topoisomerase [Aphelenchoides bicaudatus]|nr:DNA topoisomerase [Aphelenchoides bicaudatus]
MYLDICVGNNPTAAATVTQVTRTPKTKYRPVAMDTVALEKLGVRKLRMTARRVLAAAEKLYTQGYISYPRTETTIFPPDLQLDNLVQLQSANQEWGPFAADILQRGPATPRNGNKSDGAHPPLHPVKPANKSAITNNDEWRVYELVVRHFLACCSRDARGHETKVYAKVNGEMFYTAGLAIEDRGYLLVYPYDRWTDKEIPNYREGNLIPKFEVKIRDGTTTAPPLLTEADLIALMDRHGIGTDATHAEHIEKIQQRNYVAMTNDRRFRPTFMGMALVDGYNRMGQELLSRPELRSGLETQLLDIVEGRRTKEQVLQNQLQIYRQVFTIAERNIENLTLSLNHFMRAMPN